MLSRTITVGARGDFTTITQAIEALLRRQLAPDAVVDIALAAGIYTEPSPVMLDTHTARKISISGAPPIGTTMSSVQSVTGSAGAWVVTLNVASVAGITAGMVANLRAVKPGVQAPGSYTTRPVQGALQMQFFTCGRLAINGTSATASDSDLETFADDGDLLVAGGAVREMTAVTNGSPSTFTIAGTSLPADIEEEPLDDDPTQYWYTMRSCTGTITIAGTAVTGDGTTFTTQLNPGDLVGASGGGMRKVASIQDDTHLTLTKSSMDMPAGTKWGCITPGELHEGCFVITSVDTDNNRITYVNASRLTLAPPIINVSSGTLTVYPTVLNFGTASGLIVNGDRWSGNNIALVGGNGPSNVGINLRGFDDSRSSAFAWGPSAAVVGFDYGARIGPRSWLDAAGATFSGSYVRGVDLADGANADLAGACISASAGYGVYWGAGSFARINAAVVCGHGSFGGRLDVGSSTWADFSIFSWNVSDNFRATNAALIHVVGARLIGSQNSSGLTGENGGFGRASGAIVLCNNAHGVNLTGALIEINYLMAIGNGSTGIVATDCPRVSLFRGHVGYNVGNGLLVQRGGRASVDGSNFVGNTTHIRAVDGTRVFAELCGFSDAITQDIHASERAEVYLRAYSSEAELVTTPALNVPDTSGAVVTDGTATEEGAEETSQALEVFGGAALDGATNYLDGLALTGIADGKTGHFVWVGRPANAAVASEYLLNNTGNAVDVIRTTDGDIRIRLENAAGTIILGQESDTQPCLSGDTVYAVMMSWDLANELFQLYVNDAAIVMPSGQTLDDDTAVYIAAEYSVGANTAGSLKFTGDKYLVRFGTEYVDFSSGTTRRLFWDATNGIIPFQGRSGEIPTGTAPQLLLAYDSGAKFAQNKGSSGGTFAINGTLAAPTEPIYGPYGAFFDRSGVVIVTDDYTVGVLDTVIIVDKGSTAVLGMPDPADFNGRTISVRTVQAQAVESDAAVISVNNAAAVDAMLPATAGAWRDFTCDGAVWHVGRGSV